MEYQDNLFKRILNAIVNTFLEIGFFAVVFLLYYIVMVYRWVKKMWLKIYSICFYCLLITMLVFISQAEAPQVYTVTLTKEDWKNVLWVISKSEAPGPVVKKVTDLINRQLPDTLKINK